MNRIHKILIAGLLLSIFLSEAKGQDRSNSSMERVKEFIRTSDKIWSDISTKRHPLPRKKMNFIFDTTAVLISGCDESACRIEDIRLKHVVLDSINQKKDKRGKRDLSFYITPLPGNRFFIDHNNRPAHLQTRVMGHILSYIVEVKEGKVVIVDRRNLVVM